MSKGTHTAYRSWGGYPPAVPPKAVLHPRYQGADMRLPDGPALAFGNGRSYGDVCLNGNGTLIDMRTMDKFISFDEASGRLCCETGVTLEAILQIIVPKGWFLPVTPGTKFVTLGGAIANDVHGKNHHVRGSFGCHIRRLGLYRSSGERITCSAEENTDIFFATIGGMGLTGLITWAEISLVPIHRPHISMTSRRFGSFADFVALSREAEPTHEHIVAWVDTTSPKGSVRGIFMQGNYARPEEPEVAKKGRQLGLAMPFNAPEWALNGLSVRAFNAAYLRRPLGKGRQIVGYDGFFYPLDGLRDWNRLYGKRGFLQFQCVVPIHLAADMFSGFLDHLRRHGAISFLSVLKLFGDVRSLGLLSFPRPGATFALDIPYRGEETVRTLRGLYDEVIQAGGALYPAKDAVMTQEHFLASYPAWEDFCRFRDPAFSSDLVRRIFGR